jgi:hypothetical protein
MSYIYSYDFNTFKNFSIIYVNIFEDKIFINKDTINHIIIILDIMYINNFLILFLLTYVILFIFYNKRKKYILVNTIESKIIKDEIIKL